MAINSVNPYSNSYISSSMTSKGKNAAKNGSNANVIKTKTVNPGFDSYAKSARNVKDSESDAAWLARAKAYQEARANYRQPIPTKAEIEAKLGMTLEESGRLLELKWRLQDAIWDQEFDEWMESDLTEIKEKFKGKAVNIFEQENEYITKEIKEFLKDKPVTAVRYHRIYEDDPLKADKFIKNIMENGDKSIIKRDLNEKYLGWEYMDVLEHINALLEKNLKDAGDGFTNFYNVYQSVFDKDDEIASGSKRLGIYITVINEKNEKVSHLKLYKPVGIGNRGEELFNSRYSLGMISDKGCDILPGQESFKAGHNWIKYISLY